MGEWDECRDIPGWHVLEAERVRSQYRLDAVRRGIMGCLSRRIEVDPSLASEYLAAHRAAKRAVGVCEQTRDGYVRGRVC